LAVIPYAITSYLNSNINQIHSKLKIGILLLGWLLFLPNSFYIITDLVHVVRSTGTIFYLDLIIICSFAIGGFLLGILSIIDFENTFEKSIHHTIKPYLIPTLCLLCGFGIYLGRILRFNSWDIISNPFQLTESIFIELLNGNTSILSPFWGIHLLFIVVQKIYLQLNILPYDQKQYQNATGIRSTQLAAASFLIGTILLILQVVFHNETTFEIGLQFVVFAFL